MRTWISLFVLITNIAVAEDKLGFDDQFVGAALEYGELVGDVGIHGMMLLLQSAPRIRAAEPIGRSSIEQIGDFSAKGHYAPLSH